MSDFFNWYVTLCRTNPFAAMLLLSLVVVFIAACFTSAFVEEDDHGR